MPYIDLSLVGWMLTALQVLGLSSAWIARVSEGSSLQTACQAGFLFLLCLMGAATAASLALGPGTCLSCGLTVSLMAVAAICDFNPARRAEAF